VYSVENERKIALVPEVLMYFIHNFLSRNLEIFSNHNGKCWYPNASLYGVIIQKNSSWIFTAVKTSHLTRTEYVKKLDSFSIQRAQISILTPTTITEDVSCKKCQYNDHWPENEVRTR